MSRLLGLTSEWVYALCAFDYDLTNKTKLQLTRLILISTFAKLSLNSTQLNLNSN